MVNAPSSIHRLGAHLPVDPIPRTRDVGFVPLSEQATSLFGFTSSRTSFVTLLLSYCSVFWPPFYPSLPLHYAPDLSLTSSHSLSSCSISLLFHVQVHRASSVPEQFSQVLSPLHCKFCTTLTPLPDVVSVDNPFPPHFLISTHSKDTHTVSYLPSRYRSMSEFIAIRHLENV